MSKTTKQTGTKASSTKATPKERVANRVKKIAAKHQAIREAGKRKIEPAILPICPACKSLDVVVTPNGQSCSKCGHNEPKVPAGQGGKPTSPVAHDNILLRVEPGQFADALNKATVDQLEDALKLECWSAKQRSRIEAALKTRTEPAKADDVAKAVAAVTKGDLTKGVEVPTAGTKKPAAKTAKAPKADGKMSGLDAAAKVLAESATPLNAKQIIEQAAAKGYWTSPGGKTPHATIYAAMTVEIAKKGDQARFKKADRGLFTVTAAGKQAK